LHGCGLRGVNSGFNDYGRGDLKKSGNLCIVKCLNIQSKRGTEMKSVKGVMKEQQKEVKKYAHEADVELIKPHIEELKELFENN
jgi:hypothetical protein